MTHEELLAKVNKDIEDDEWYDKTAVFNFHIYAKALRAVVELHKPSQIDNALWCNECSKRFENSGYYEVYPCPTIQAIEKELQ